MQVNCFVRFNGINYKRKPKGRSIDKEVEKALKKRDNSYQAQLNKYAAYEIYKRTLRLVPVKTGDLRNSAYIRKIGIGYEIGFTEYYAIFVHERLELKHKEPTQAKFLEDPATAVMYELENEVDIGIQYQPELKVFIGLNKGTSLMDVTDETAYLEWKENEEEIREYQGEKIKLWKERNNIRKRMKMLGIDPYSNNYDTEDDEFVFDDESYDYNDFI